MFKCCFCKAYIRDCEIPENPVVDQVNQSVLRTSKVYEDTVRNPSDADQNTCGNVDLGPQKQQFMSIPVEPLPNAQSSNESDLKQNKPDTDLKPKADSSDYFGIEFIPNAQLFNKPNQFDLSKAQTDGQFRAEPQMPISKKNTLTPEDLLKFNQQIINESIGMDPSSVHQAGSLRPRLEILTPNGNLICLSQGVSTASSPWISGGTSFSGSGNLCSNGSGLTLTRSGNLCPNGFGLTTPTGSGLSSTRSGNLCPNGFGLTTPTGSGLSSTRSGNLCSNGSGLTTPTGSGPTPTGSEGPHTVSGNLVPAGAASPFSISESSKNSQRLKGRSPIVKNLTVVRAFARDRIKKQNEAEKRINTNLLHSNYTQKKDGVTKKGMASPKKGWRT